MSHLVSLIKSLGLYSLLTINVDIILAIGNS